MRGTFQPKAAASQVRFPYMWTTVLVMALAVIFEPIRLGLAVLMLNRRRPMLQLFTFLCGGFTMGIGVGLVIAVAVVFFHKDFATANPVSEHAATSVNSSTLPPPPLPRDQYRPVKARTLVWDR